MCGFPWATPQRSRSDGVGDGAARRALSWKDMFHACFPAPLPSDRRWRVVSACAGMDTPSMGLKEPEPEHKQKVQE